MTATAALHIFDSNFKPETGRDAEGAPVLSVAGREIPDRDGHVWRIPGGYTIIRGVLEDLPAFQTVPGYIGTASEGKPFTLPGALAFSLSTGTDVRILPGPDAAKTGG